METPAMELAVRTLAQKNLASVGELYQTCQIMQRAMPVAASIDNYIEAQQGTPHVEALGKLAIALRILQAERSTKLFFDGRQGERPPLTELSRHWHASLCRYLFENVHWDGVGDVFDNVAFIVFNYDRCLEMFLFCALKDYYNLSDAQAGEVMTAVTIIHPYGSVGPLAWNRPHDSYGFGAQLHASELLTVSGKIVTFSESLECSRANDILGVVSEARTAVFLGFSYLQQNMNLLENVAAIERVYATAWKMSVSDVGRAKDRISDTFRMPPDAPIEVSNSLDAKALMAEYSLSITQ